jgi:gluconolactonase
MHAPVSVLNRFCCLNWLSLAAFAVVGTAGSSGAADVDIRDAAEFGKIVAPDAKLQKLATDMQFTEGPVWVAADGGFLVFSDIPADELKKWTAKDGLTTFRKPSRNANGNTVDRQGRLVTCEHSGRRVSLLEKDGSLVTVVDRFGEKQFNSPNDVAVKSDGTIWFTDPDYGLRGQPRDYDGCYVFRFDPKSKALTVLVKDFDKPNGIAFSPDEKRLYVADSGKPRHIRVFDVQQDGTVGNGRVFCEIDKGVPDGIRCDAAGRVWSSAGDGVHIFAPDGKLIGKILLPEAPANLCFGGADGKTLFITARKSLYSIPVRVKGAN